MHSADISAQNLHTFQFCAISLAGCDGCLVKWFSKIIARFWNATISICSHLPHPRVSEDMEAEIAGSSLPFQSRRVGKETEGAKSTPIVISHFMFRSAANSTALHFLIAGQLGEIELASSPSSTSAHLYSSLHALSPSDLNIGSKCASSSSSFPVATSHFLAPSLPSQPSDFYRATGKFIFIIVAVIVVIILLLPPPPHRRRRIKPSSLSTLKSHHPSPLFSPKLWRLTRPRPL